MAKKEWTEPKPMCEKLQYLIGVPSQYIDNFDALNKGELREIRKLCSLRSLIIDKFTEINEQFRNYVQLADISITSRLVNDLAEMGIVIQNAHSLSRNIIELNELIDARIEKIALGFKGIPQEWIRELFQMPNGDSVDGVRAAVRKYRQYKNFYPYQKYINFRFAETPEDKRSKNILGNDRDLHELLAEMHRDKSVQLMDFIGTNKDVVVVVDCENSDAQRLYDALSFLKKNLCKIILIDDTHTNQMWDELVREYEYYRSDYEGRKYDYYINGVNMNGYFHYLTRGAYDVAYMTSTATSAGAKITIDKTHKSIIPKLGLVDTSKDANPEFTCCFCERSYSGKRNKHSAGATRPKTNDEGIPNYCCSSCFKKYVVPMIGYAYKLRLVRGLPGYEDVPRDEKEIFASIQKMSLREIKDTIKREDIAELVLPTLEMLAHGTRNMREKPGQWICTSAPCGRSWGTMVIS